LVWLSEIEVVFCASWSNLVENSVEMFMIYIEDTHILIYGYNYEYEYVYVCMGGVGV
jgi:hypothetical protein